MEYEELSGAKLTFGDADAAINGTTAGLPGGLHDPHFTGFHRIEYGLWHGESPTGLHSVADRLAADVNTLRKNWPRQEMDPLYLSQRGHEIMENALPFELTGRTDYSSGTNLATVRANLTGTKEMLDRMRPLLNSRAPGLMTKIGTWMQRTERDVDGFEHDGHWTPVGRLGQGQHETLDADVGNLTEELAPIAAILDVRRTQ
ncbi:EfeM/EfeO family lipoprotein [Streptomyces sp. NBC_00005]|uniref:EfeM/EfeO family lipoprotein n=1 Tax=Streptomyces sp. NBC_00005 TaxID=2903609 RepID=UPI00324381D1